MNVLFSNSTVAFFLGLDGSLGVDSFTTQREYRLCGNTTFPIGALNETSFLVTPGLQFPLLLFQPNVHVFCGGSNCNLQYADVETKGRYHVFAPAVALFNGILGGRLFQDNLMLEGLTFTEAQSSQVNPIILDQPGRNMSIKDCVIKDLDNADGILRSAYSSSDDFLGEYYTDVTFLSNVVEVSFHFLCSFLSSELYFFGRISSLPRNQAREFPFCLGTPWKCHQT